MHVKFYALNERLEWYKKRSLFAKWVIQKNSGTLAVIHSCKNESNST